MPEQGPERSEQRLRPRCRDSGSWVSEGPEPQPAPPTQDPEGGRRGNCHSLNSSGNAAARLATSFRLTQSARRRGNQGCETSREERYLRLVPQSVAAPALEPVTPLPGVKSPLGSWKSLAGSRRPRLLQVPPPWPFSQRPEPLPENGASQSSCPHFRTPLHLTLAPSAAV